MLIAAAWLLAPALSAGFRSEDFLDFEYYSQASLREVVAGSHLGMELLRFWRPLADVATWGLVHALGPQPGAVHFALVLLQAATAAATGRVLRRLLGLSEGAAWAGALLVLVHPFAPAVLTYVDGGVPTLLAGLFTLLALGELGEWRDGNGRAGRLVAWTAAAALSYDPALLVAPLLCAVAWLLPRSERRVPWLLLLVPPAVVAARALLGVGYLGYPVRPDRQMVVEFVPRVATVVARQFAAVFPGELHSVALAALAYAALAAVVLGAVVVAVRTRIGSVAVAVRQAAALALLVVGLVGFAPDLWNLGGPPGQPPTRPQELVFAYKTWPASAAAALALAWLFGRASGRRWWGALALALPWAAVELALRAPIQAVHAEAVAWAQRVCDGVAARADEARATRLLVLEVPVANGVAPGFGGTRVLQYGLGAALRPPCHTPPLDAYPIFRMDDGMERLATAATIDALAASPWFLPLSCSEKPAVAVVAIARPHPRAGAGTLRLFADASGREPVLAADLSDAPTVVVDPREEIELFVAGDAPGRLQLVVVNRIQPVFVTAFPAPPLPPDAPPRPPPAMDLVRERRESGPDRLVARLADPGAWFREIATRYPGDVVFLVLEARPDAARSPGTELAVTTSNVLPVRLTRGAGARH
ncbi:MAG TPA: hypothetical protein VFG37_15230 [Planctomycetota bacterium]|nr:hypothetical protein [Planctomycetota bacterium]